MKNQVTELLISELIRKPEPALDAQDIYFLKRYYHRLSSQDYDPSEAFLLRDCALAHRELGKRREPGEVIIQLQNVILETTRTDAGPERTIIYIILDDIPFAVNSLQMKLTALSKTAARLFHPHFEVTRGPGRYAQGYFRVDRSGESRHADSCIESYIQFTIEYTPETEHGAIIQALRTILTDIKTVVSDWQPMREHAEQCADQLQHMQGLPKSAEYRELLQWMVNDHFAFMGYCEMDYPAGPAGVASPIPDTLLGILRTANENGEDLANSILPPTACSRKSPVVITKARTMSEIHRPGYMDCILISPAAGQDEPVRSAPGHRVRCILGFMTGSIETMPTLSIPYIREKARYVLETSALRKTGHAYKELNTLLNTLPRDKLLHMEPQKLYALCMTLLNQERRKTRLHLHRHVCGHFYSCLVYVPRDLFNSALRLRIQKYLTRVLHASAIEFEVYFSKSILTRIHYTIHTDPSLKPEYEAARMELDVRQIARDWYENLFETLKSRHSHELAQEKLNRYQGGFPVMYREDFDAAAAVQDIQLLDDLAEGQIQARLTPSIRKSTSVSDEINASFKIYSRELAIALSDILPILENMGVRIHSGRPYRVSPETGKRFLLLDFEISRLNKQRFDFERHAHLFEETFVRCWNGEIENDRYNSLSLIAELDWRLTSVFRAYYRYLRQIRLRYSENYIIETLVRNPDLVVSISQLFSALLDPGRKNSGHRKHVLRINTQLEQVATLDEERIVRALVDVIQATLRTNYFQLTARHAPKPYISFKLNPSAIPRIPVPAPHYEIFVYSPRVEGVHLRGGKVARGGLRWSERPEDFRTEILGLAKAQHVKNTIIVPVGSKGGFVAKRLSQDSPDAIRKEVVACYRTFIRGLLDLTDNIVDGRIIPPDQVTRHDDDDPYLVVAADKGTATFSDIANEISTRYGFWLGDAFASGGSAGYDHKRMGITARGAWESVKRHFREFGKDIQEQTFTVAGIGDMSGDVFGNGMLLSRKTRLIAAFNHLNVFIDPDPDPDISYEERQRLFNLPRSAWSDYDTQALSPGGGVYSRQDKAIHLSRQAKKALGVNRKVFTPDELIAAILMAPVEMLWNGGIGTYVKSSSETHADAQDRHNDAVRVDARDLRCKVIGEGGNLGMTQLARIEFSRQGGLCYTDAIDNSAGVDTSDHEVNIKILLNSQMLNRTLTLKQRNAQLTQMEEDVAELVLANNYLQTQILSIEAENGQRLMPQHIRTMLRLEEEGLLNRSVEFLPDDAELAERLEAQQYLTRPELSVLMAYSKMDLYQKLLDSGLPDDEYLSREIEAYFPALINAHYPEQIHQHQLKREIIATQVTNSMIGDLGTTFHARQSDLTGRPAHQICAAYIAARQISDNQNMVKQVQELDNRMDASVQMEAFNRLCRAMESTIIWILKNDSHAFNIPYLIDRYSKPYLELCRNLDSIMSHPVRIRYERIFNNLVKAGAPEPLVREITGRDILCDGIDITDIALENHTPVLKAGKVYFGLSETLKTGWIYKHISALEMRNIWQERARFSLLSELRTHQSNLAGKLLARYPRRKPERMLDLWREDNQDQTASLHGKINALKQEPSIDFAMLSVLVSELGQFR